MYKSKMMSAGCSAAQCCTGTNVKSYDLCLVVDLDGVGQEGVKSSLGSGFSCKALGTCYTKLNDIPMKFHHIPRLT